MQKVDDLDSFKEELVAYQESHLQRYPDRWFGLVIIYLDLKTCLDELIANIFKHGYPDRQLRPQVVIVVRGSIDCLEIEITDNAIPFDSSSSNNQQQPLLGLDLIRKLTDRLDYQRLANGNRVTLFKQTTGG